MTVVLFIIITFKLSMVLNVYPQPLTCQILTIRMRQWGEICSNHMNDEHHDYMALPLVNSTNEKRNTNGRDKSNAALAGDPPSQPRE